MTAKYTPQDVADALTVFIRSGSASGNEAMRKYCLSRVELFADADRLRTVNAELVAALGELLNGRDYVLSHGGDLLTSASWYKAEKAYKETA